MNEVSRKSGCGHRGCRFKRLGILQGTGTETEGKHFLMVCQCCGSTVSTRTLRAQKELRDALTLNLALL